MAAVVVEHADLKTRACVDSSAVEHYRLRGWTPVGPAAEPGAVETADERDARTAAAAAAERALFEKKSPAAAGETPKTDKPSTRRGR